MNPQTPSTNPFTEDYYLRGPETGLSNYEDYRWLPDMTHAYVMHLARHLGIKNHESVHDIGCSRGYLVKSLQMHGIQATGHDISEWAVANCDESVKGFISNKWNPEPMSVDWVHSKDVLEHCDEDAVEKIITQVMESVRKGAFFIVPLCSYHRGSYIYPNDNKDSTHVIRFTMENWLSWITRLATIFDRSGLGKFTVSGSYHVPGLKQASVDYPFSTAFIQLRRFQ